MTEVCRLAMQFTLLQIALGLVLAAFGCFLWWLGGDMKRRAEIDWAARRLASKEKMRCASGHDDAPLGPGRSTGPAMRRLAYPDDDDMNWWLDQAEETLDHFYAVHRILKRRRFKKHRQRLHMPLRQMLIRHQTATLCRGRR